MTDFHKAMEELAAAVAKKAQLDATPLAESTDALKALTPYLALLFKYNNKATDEDAESSFNDFKMQIHGADEGQDNGGAAPTVRSRPRRRADA